MWRSYSAAQPGSSPGSFQATSSLFATSRISFEQGEDEDSVRSRCAAFGATGSARIAGIRDQAESEEAARAYAAWQGKHPCILTHFESFKAAVEGKRLAVFLDYDGTLTPIVSNPDDAVMSEEMRDVVRAVAQAFPTAIISGRGREKVETFVQLKELFYAGSHGMDIAGPRDESGGSSIGSVFQSAFQPAAHFRPLIDAVYECLEARLKAVPGSSVEHNNFCVSAHFRNCPGEAWQSVISAVEDIVAQHSDLRMTRGRKVVEIRPKVDWHKGTALTHLVEALGLAQQPDVVAIYVGDDHTDEDAFRTLEETRQGRLGEAGKQGRTAPLGFWDGFHGPEQRAESL
ncbi:putative trehalose-phosphate phosphatase D [Tetrabaena socialis]|uniref:Trehalose 6-phosphate phosphatase n=1 Tax=Tetrabaena socialis TaxID=47790 RepID=A0A2J7ZQR7_9CHLO|nr:putative trehalose-phosphate phosphatase D [Tetrabaena socialis]|eukprot:PNH02607.1 putative trehalose-phosphate phosphatase D [Tetrabaena socialis]